MITSHPPNSQPEILQQVVAELRKEGWSTNVEPRGTLLPETLRDFTPDLIASRGDEILVVEFASRQTAKSEQIDALSRRVAALPRARFEVYWLGDTPEHEPALLDVLKLTNEASLISELSPAAGLLTAWAALEGAITHFATKAGEASSWQPPRRLLSTLSSKGLINEADFDRLIKLSTLRNIIAHQGRPMTPARADIKYLIEFTQRLATGKYISSDQMAEWFLEHYEDPVNQLPYDHHEGGYQYFDNGPHDAGDIMRDKFPDATEADIEEAVRLVEETSTDWVTKRGTEPPD
ncbi:hypothetical protein GA0070216_12835 [Micromonospora matsumotoense]|uniref:REase AHJR-like domain-containing protein n=1 Tax=Micromonospora matsumotoense TaxID=121616 RepID=A0A1C5AU41_9ACTN|nr:hypothetical protein [Micromonospora matsumotoense]SCF48737.1 hypothetical protein GA0070216_12835 [Micromonospora matsumotoense]